MYLLLFDSLDKIWYIGLSLLLEELMCEVDGHSKAENAKDLVLFLFNEIHYWIQHN